MCQHCCERPDLPGHAPHRVCCFCKMDLGPAQEMPYHESPLQRQHELEARNDGLVEKLGAAQERIEELEAALQAEKDVSTVRKLTAENWEKQCADLCASIEIRERNAGEMTFQLRDANRLIDAMRPVVEAARTVYEVQERAMARGKDVGQVKAYEESREVHLAACEAMNKAVAAFNAKAIEKPNREKLIEESKALLDPHSPGWNEGAQRLFNELRDRKEKRVEGRQNCSHEGLPCRHCGATD